MKITNNAHVSAVNAYNNTGKPSKAPQTGHNTDTVDISGSHFDATKVSSSFAKEIASDVSPERIQALKQSIADGTYNVAADLLADALIGRA